jgi:anti-sigma factor RsiW
VTPEDARGLYSDYVENNLDDATRDELQAYLAKTPDAAAELIGFERTLTVLHRLPPREPSLDLWREFAPKLAAYQAERKQGWRQRIRLNWTRMLSELSSGVILWTHALADRSHARFERYLLQDPLARSSTPHNRGDF